MMFMRTMSICAAAIVAIAMAGPAAATADEAPPAKVAVWNYDVLGDAYRVTEPGPVVPVTLVGARNGTFSGAVAVQSAKPITGLRASMGKPSPNTVLYGIADICYEAHATLAYQVNPDKGRLHG